MNEGQGLQIAKRLAEGVFLMLAEDLLDSPNAIDEMVNPRTVGIVREAGLRFPQEAQISSPAPVATLSRSF